MAYLIRPAASFSDGFATTITSAPKSPVPQLEAMLERSALEVAVLDLFWTGDE